jgi:hypothetical protein
LRGRAGAEIYAMAPVPLASASPDGKVRVGNAAFWDFLGVAGEAGGVDLADSGLLTVYPNLMADLETVAHTRETIKTVVFLAEGGGSTVEAAIILSAPPAGSEATGGDVHLCIHPLRTIRRTGDTP